MNLSLYLLLASENDIEFQACTVTFPASSPVIAAGQLHQPIYDPYRPAGKPLQQASFRNYSDKSTGSTVTSHLAFGASVLANALGFLVMTSGLMLLLQIAQTALR